ncbi:hypothetical protein GON01_01000 [Sphingomonas sp. MAH-20]|uniref:Uncharacterized protein n=1 Tax=Sphingomonas horti TaxID=2682842 RepID=A0A6I4IX20_9SPHN|nr:MULTISPECIES: hypothetical protein [Sphingomonas]MBA2920264.1 hypothetical protein [Sphingomonas sp. CGMCC 1.13658]MVO76518.1 hypothetical protein [Sphingomonas horti]
MKKTIDQSKGGQRVRAGVTQSEEPGADLAQLSAEEARCFITGNCSVEAEKKFSLANIGSASSEPNRGGGPIVAPPSISDMSIALVGTGPVCDLGFRPFRLAFYDSIGQTVIISGPRRTQRELNLRQMLEFVNWPGPRRKFKKVGEVTFRSGSGQTVVPIIATKVRRESIARLKARLAAAGCTAQAAAL